MHSLACKSKEVSSHLHNVCLPMTCSSLFFLWNTSNNCAYKAVFTCICVHIYIYIYMHVNCICIYVFMSRCIYMCICIYVNTYVCMFLFAKKKGGFPCWSTFLFYLLLLIKLSVGPSEFSRRPDQKQNELFCEMVCYIISVKGLHT